LLAEEVELACPRQPLGQRSGLLAPARLLQAFEQAFQRWRPDRRARVIEGDAGGRIAAQQRSGLALSGQRPQAVQQRGYGARVIEGGVRDGPACGAGVIGEARRTPAEVGSGA